MQRVSGLKPEAHHSSKHVRWGAAEKQSIKISFKTGILVCGASSKLSWNSKSMWEHMKCITQNTKRPSKIIKITKDNQGIIGDTFCEYVKEFCP